MLLKGMEFDTTHFITDVSGKYPRLWALKRAHPHSPQSVPLHQVFEKSRNYQTGLVMTSKNHGTTTPT
ncbi:hypothetical protein ACS0TY_019773 [Phlomoides rotata]